MADFPTRAELFNIGADEVLVRSQARPIGQRLSADEVFTEGSDINIAIASASAMAEECIRQHCRGVKDQTLDGAEGDALDRWIADRYSQEIPRKKASVAVVDLEFSRTSTAAGAATVDAGTQVETPNGIRFETLTDVSLDASSLGPVSVQAEAINAGIQGNVQPSTITRFVGAKPDPTMSVSNPERSAGGGPSESDADYRERGRAFFRAARRGILAAIEFGALSTPGVQRATVEEDLDESGLPTGIVRCFIADASGQGNTALANAVKSNLREWRSAGIIVDVFAATPVFQRITYRLRFKSGVDSTVAFATVQAIAVSRVNALKPQETLTLSLLFEIARSVDGVIVLEDAVVEPVGDVVPAQGEIIRTSRDLVTQASP